MSVPRGTARRSIDIGAAWRAIRLLLADPERTDQVFVIIRALTGDSFERLYQRVMADPQGRAILDERRSLLATLQDRDALRALPAGTLGNAYAAFMDAQGISADGLVDASMDQDDVEDVRFLDDRAQVLSERMRDMHDLWHVSAGYDRDLLGEASLLAFTYGQSRNRGIGFIVFVALLRMLRAGHFAGMRTVFDGFSRGRHAAYMPAADWEHLLTRPLGEVRATLGLGDPPTYTPLWADPAPTPA